MEAVNYLSRASDDACYLRHKTRESMRPMQYVMSQQYPATCPGNLPLTTECRGFHQGPASIDAASTYRNGTQLYNAEQDFKRPPTELIERSAFLAGGEGRFSSAAIDTESALLAPPPSGPNCRRRQTEEKEWARWDMLPCSQIAVEPFRRAGETTRTDVYCAVQPAAMKSVGPTPMGPVIVPGISY